MVNLGYLFESANRLEDAVYWYDKARVLFHQLGSLDSYYITVGNLGWCYLRLGDSEKGLANLDEAEAHARQIGDRYHEQLWIGNSGSVLYDRGDLPRAAEKFKRALEIAQSLDRNEKDRTASWNYDLASVFIDLGTISTRRESYNQRGVASPSGPSPVPPNMMRASMKPTSQAGRNDSRQ